MTIQQISEEVLQEQLPQASEKPINIPDPEYTPPTILTSKNANKKVASHLEFLKQLTQ